MKNVFSKGMIGSLMALSMLASVSANATNLPEIDSVVTTTFDKSLIQGSLAHDELGNLVYDGAGNARFIYTGKIYATATSNQTGELTSLGNQIGNISGEAAFPPDFVALSSGVNALMGMMRQYKETYPDATDQDVFNYVMPYMPKLPAIVPWTCNHCDMIVAGSRYVSIVDVLTEGGPFYNAEMAGKLAMMVDGDAMDLMRMKGRAFTGLTPATFDYMNGKMGVRMAGCSALVAIDGPNAGKVGTLCMNATAVFDVNSAAPIFNDSMQLIGYEPTSQISAEGSSNCVTVLHDPTM